MKLHPVLLLLGLLLAAPLVLAAEPPVENPVPEVPPGPEGIERPVRLEDCQIDVVARPHRGARRVGVVDVEAVRPTEIVLDEQALGTACELLATEAVPDIWYFDATRKSHVRLVLYSTITPGKPAGKPLEEAPQPPLKEPTRRGNF